VLNASSPSTPLPSPTKPAEPPATLRRCQPALGTLVELHLAGLPLPRLELALASARRELARCELHLSAHLPANDLARLRNAPSGATLALDLRTCAVLRRAARLSTLGDGLFDPRRTASQNAPEASSSTNHARLPFAAAFLHLPRHRMRVLAPLDLDLGGIAKGYALDRALASLRRAGVPSACLNAGGDLLTHGQPARLLLRSPLAADERFFHLGTLHAGAAATSAQTYRRHLLHPRTGKPASSRLSYTVLAPTAWLADALTKLVALAPAQTAAGLARHRAFAASVDRQGQLRWLTPPPPASVFTP